MKAVPDLRIESFDELFAHENRVCVRYTAAGSHCGVARRGIAPTGRHARWTAACVFHLNENGKITHMKKDWDKLAMWHALGWTQLVGPHDLQ
jgi:predicted ester cyclase